MDVSDLHFTTERWSLNKSQVNVFSLTTLLLDEEFKLKIDITARTGVLEATFMHFIKPAMCFLALMHSCGL